MQLGQLHNSFGDGVTCPGLRLGCCGSGGSCGCASSRGKTQRLSQDSLAGCVVFALSPLCRALCAGRALSAPRAAMPWAVWSHRAVVTPAPVLLPLYLLASGKLGLQGCQAFFSSTSQAFRYLKSQRALVHTIKECQVIPLCS